MENQDEKKTYENLLNQIKMISLKLRNSIDRNDMRQVLKFSVDILSTLKNDFKSISLYKNLFSNVIEELSPLKNYFIEEINRGRRIKEFFEAVQQCITVLPRVYLSIIVGNIYIENCKDEKKYILEEISKMLTGMQIPLRGYIVRYYFLKIFDKSLNDIDILLTNLKEMNKLWIRIGHLKHYLGSDGIKARNELKDMIGENILKLAKIENLDNDLYKNKILSPMLKIIIECEDYLSQEYFLLQIINLFPDELNIKNIDIIITSLGQMKEKVDIKKIFINIMEKLGNFDSVEKLKDIKSNEIFEKLNGSIEKIIQEMQNEEDDDNNDILQIIELEVSYLKFIINFGTYEDKSIKIKNINKIITKCYDLISKACGGRSLSEEGTKIIFNLLQAILDSPFSIFKCKNFPDLMGYLNEEYKNQLSLNILDSLVNKYNLGMIDSTDKMESIIEFIGPMIDIEDNKGSDYLLDKALNKICKLVFIPSSKNPFEQIEMMQMLKQSLIESTEENEEELKNKKLILYFVSYINALILIGYSIIESYLNTNINEQNKNKKTKIQKDFCSKYNMDKFDIKNPESFSEFYKLLIKEISTCISSLSNISTNMAFKLYCQFVLLLNKIAYSFINRQPKEKESKENTIVENNKFYEENIISNINNILSLFTEDKIDQKNKYDYLTFFIGCLSAIKILDKENLITISEKLIKIIDKIPKKNEQCLSYINCTKLYYNEINKDLSKITELLKKSKKTAVFAMTNPENVILFIYILNEYLRYDGLVEDFDKIIKLEDVNEIIEAITNYLMSLKSENNNKELVSRIDNFYKNTKNLINSLKNKDKESKYYKLFSKINLEKDE